VIHRFLVVSVAVLALGVPWTAWAANAEGAATRETVPAKPQAIVRYERAFDAPASRGRPRTSAMPASTRARGRRSRA
jgi:hypothetical protein